MIFTADKPKVVRVGAGKYASFKGGKYETTDKDEIALLKKAKGVKEVVKSASKADK